jgi:hypothetical protein
MPVLCSDPTRLCTRKDEHNFEYYLLYGVLTGKVTIEDGRSRGGRKVETPDGPGTGDCPDPECSCPGKASTRYLSLSLALSLGLVASSGQASCCYWAKQPSYILLVPPTPPTRHQNNGTILFLCISRSPKEWGQGVISSSFYLSSFAH